MAVNGGTPPYLSNSIFNASLNGLGDNIPEYLDRKMLTNVPEWAGFYVMSAYRFLGLIDEDNKVQDRLRRLARAKGAERQAVLREVLIHGYPFVFDDPQGFSLATGTSEQLSERFRSLGVSGDTIRKGVAFLLNAAREAGMPVADDLRAVRIDKQGKLRKRGARKPSANNLSNSGIPPKSDGNGRSQDALGSGEHMPNGNITPSKDEGTNGDTDGLASKYELVSSYLNHLPKNGRWTTRERERWFKAFESAVDFYAEVVDRTN